MSASDATARARHRAVVRPLAALVLVSAATFALARLHLARPAPPRLAPGLHIVLGDVYRGETVFMRSCAGCHGQGGDGGGVGPRLRGDRISLLRALQQIESGGGAMPAHVVTGQDERDVLAYLATIIARPRR
jgi:mono/diheme cytochrome c family protein